MGLDIYLRWTDFGKEEMSNPNYANQMKGYDITIGKNGYLRGAYNGHIGLQAINILFSGIDMTKDWIVDIELLKKNLEILENGLFKTNKKEFYSANGKDLEIQSYRDFVKLAEKLIKQKKKVLVHFSG
ncbi:MAG: hypothetical protein AABY22_02985 [Nanoarchaeota archaeon]